MSDNDWADQFKKSVLPAFRENIFHRQNLIKQKEKLRGLKDGLIILDECHIASGSKMTIAKTLKETGILNLDVLQLRNIKMLDISATPDAVLHDYEKWGDKCVIVKIKPGPLYKGFEVMKQEKRIIDSPNLEDIEDYRKLLKELDERYENTTKKYFPFRLLDSSKINILESVCEEFDWDYKNHNSDERIVEIDEMMENPPENHTIIFIKGFWRASKRISMKHIGATYEQIPKQRDVSVTAQALTARFCDNYEYLGDQLDVNLRPLHYCDKEAIEQYINWFNNDCKFSESKYSSSRVSSNGNGKVKAKPTKVNFNFVSETNDNETTEIIKEFDTQEEVKQFYLEEPDGLGLHLVKTKIRTQYKKKEVKNIVKVPFTTGNFKYHVTFEDETITIDEKEYKKYRGNGPRQRTPNEHGFYEATIKKITKVWSTEEIKNKPYIGTNNNDYRYYPCYENVNDKSTLKWLLIYEI